MKRILSILTFFLLLTLIMLEVLFAEEKSYRLRVQSYYPPTLIHGHKRFAKLVDEMSAGRIKMMLFVGGELVASDNILKAVKAGTIDMGIGSGPYFSELKIGTIEMGLPFAWLDPFEAELAFEQFGLGKLVAEEYAEHGVHYISHAYAAPYNLITKTPLKSVEQLKKLKIRATSAAGKTLSKLGTATVYLTPEDMYLALSTGQVDGVLFGGMLEYQSMKFFEVAKYYNATSFLNPIVDGIFMNKKKWESLPKDLQAIITAAAQRLRWEYYNSVMAEEYKLRDQRKEYTTYFSEEDVIKLTEAAQSVWDEEAKKSPRNSRAIEIYRKLGRIMGRLK